SSATARSLSPVSASARPAIVRDSAASIGAPAASAVSAEASARSAARAASPASSATAAAARSAHVAARGRCTAAAIALGKGRRAPGLGAATHDQPPPGEQLEAARSPAAWNERQLLTAGTAEEQLDGPAWLPGLEQDIGEPRRSPCCDETFVKITGESEGTTGVR